MGEMVKLRKAIEGSGRALCAEGKVAKEVSAFSGEHSVKKTDASTVEESGTGNALRKPTLPAEAPGVQMEVCEVSCSDAKGAVGETPDRPQSSVMAGVHIWGGYLAAPVMAAAQKKKKRRAAAAQTVSRGDADDC